MSEHQSESAPGGSAEARGSARCRICGKTALEIGGYLHRVNELGVVGIWECRPSCSAKLSDDDRLIAAIEGPNDQAHPTAARATVDGTENL